MEIEQKTSEIKDIETARFGFSGKVIIREHSRTPSFSGCIDMLTTARIELGYNPDYSEQAAGLEKVVSDPFGEAFTALIRHELNHKGGGRFQGCPRNINLHAENILEPVAETLKRLGYPNVPVTGNQTLYAYMANLVEDVFDNVELGNGSDHIGMFLCYKDDAQNISHKLEKKFPPLFDAFVHLQQRLYGGKRSERLLAEHCSDDERVTEAVDNFMQRTGLDNFQRTVTVKIRKNGARTRKEKQVFDRKRAVRYLMNENNWQNLSTILTEEFAPLIDKDKLHNPEELMATFLPLKGEGDDFSDEMDDKETRMKFVWKKYQQGEKEGMPFKPPAYLENNNALDLVYQRLARNLEIKTRSSTKTTAMPVMWYGKRVFDPKKDRLSKARVGLGNDGKLELTVRRYHEDMPIEHTQRRQSLPKIRFIKRDDSGSMTLPVEGTARGVIMNPWADESQQWGNRSRYHHALIAEWGLYELLRKQGALKHTSVKSVSYSHLTRTAKNLRETKRQALSPSFGGRTMMDMDKIGQLFARDELVISISDGQIHNWNDLLIEPKLDNQGNIVRQGVTVKDEYIKRARQNHYFHLQIGGPTEMSQDLEKAGLVVKYDDGRNLGKLVVDLTRPYITRTG